uniref:Uncharacterized protein n=1 Tax=Anguilla anguilla TaxID=7936 RepID=A0A0E9TC63_ANGAN
MAVQSIRLVAVIFIFAGLSSLAFLLAGP